MLAWMYRSSSSFANRKSKQLRRRIHHRHQCQMEMCKSKRCEQFLQFSGKIYSSLGNCNLGWIFVDRQTIMVVDRFNLIQQMCAIFELIWKRSTQSKLAKGEYRSKKERAFKRLSEKYSLNIKKWNSCVCCHGNIKNRIALTLYLMFRYISKNYSTKFVVINDNWNRKLTFSSLSLDQILKIIHKREYFSIISLVYWVSLSILIIYACHLITFCASICNVALKGSK